MEVSGRKPEKPFTDTVGKSSAEDGEAFCQPCSSDGDWMIAVGYCENCNEYMCSACLKVHRKQAISRNHDILEGENMPKEKGLSVTLNACSELCTKHANEIVKFYCSAHDVVGCGDCMVLDHKACTVDRIQDISTRYFNGTEHQELQQKVDQFLKNIERINKDLKTSGETMQQAYKKAENDIKAFKKEITDYLDKAETDMMAKLNKRKLGAEKLISDLQRHENTMKDDIQELHEKLQLQLNQANKLFAAAKEMKKRITRIGDSIKQLQQDCQFNQYEFVRSKHVKEMFASKFKLGELLVKRAMDKINIAEMEPIFSGEIIIKTPDDTSDCFIHACALIASSRIILADEVNKCLKIVDTENRKVSTKYKLKSGPTGVAVVARGRIAITLPNEKKIQFLTITKDDIITESYAIEVKDKCRKIACQEDKIIVAYRQHIVILSMDGQEINSTFTGSNQKWINPHIATDSKAVYVAYCFNELCNVSKFDFDGKLIGTYTDKDLVDARGLSVTRDGLVFVCNWEDAGSVHVISPECKKIKEVLKHNERVSRPWCVSLCDETYKLFLCNAVIGTNIDPKLKNDLKVFNYNRSKFN
ncbi:uncharacterized protein LOC123555979 [Mercenaria mercenaria]|uniref:uncharacterized protein LOC123555979 n=1 Tax=Mercenaria mercenaria TaxID=6596 RepID=UPI00234F1885|nr:uncharacterized protein LOC123555979 [Mercenaria mercenaria]XP_053403819.1 uncharacterized protein LOC123555979 [Mercenaria mercenaria]